jgi:hypothetical protein
MRPVLKSRRTSFLCLCAALLASAHVVAAGQQGQSSSLTGVVTDASGAVLAGVSVVVSSPQLVGGPRETHTGDDGRYRVAWLLPGTYEVRVTRSGFTTVLRKGVDLRPGLGLTIDLQLDLSPIAETLAVVAASPTIDVHSSASPTIISRQLLEHLPLDRRVIDYVNLAPGVTGNTAFGGSNHANPMSIDGTDGNEPGWGIPAATPSAYWLDAIQVVAVGAGAEYGEFTGARINAITRSGGNRFSGLTEYWTTRSNWTGNNRGSLAPALAQQFRPLEVLDQWEAIGQVGGPIRRDRLWFFGGVDYFRYARRSAAFASLPRTPDEPHTLTREPKVLLKLTAAPTRISRLEGFFARDDSIGTNSNAGPLVRPEALASFKTPSRTGNLRLTWSVASQTVVEARYGLFSQHSVSGPTAPNSRTGPPGHIDEVTGVSSVNQINFRDAEIDTHGLAATVTHYRRDHWNADHAITGGFEYEWAAATFATGWSGGAHYRDRTGQPSRLISWAGATFRTSQSRTTAWLQDTWRVTPPLTIDAGARVTFYDGAVPVEGITGYRNHSFSPRLGMAWDVESSHRTVVRAHYGRYHDPIVTSFYDFLDPLSQQPFIELRADGSGSFVEVGRAAPAAHHSIDARAKHPFAEEYLAGVERELGHRFTVRGQYLRRHFKQSLGFTDSGSTWTPVTAIDPGEDGLVGTADDGGPLTVYHNLGLTPAVLELTNPAGAYRNHDAVQIIAHRRGADMELEASYTWARTRGSFNNEFTSNAANNDMSLNGNFVNPNRGLFPGRTTQDVTHAAKVLGTYALPLWGGLRISAVYRFNGGRPWARFASMGFATRLGAMRVEPTGSRQLPAPNNLDLRLEKTFRAGSSTGIGLFLTAFNVTNQGIPLAVDSMSGSRFGVPIAWVEPRRVRAGLRLTF